MELINIFIDDNGNSILFKVPSYQKFGVMLLAYSQRNVKDYNSLSFIVNDGEIRNLSKNDSDSTIKELGLLDGTTLYVA